MKVLLKAVAAMSAVILATTAISHTASLAGQVGNKRYPVNMTNTVGDCPKTYKNYIAAFGHSAYAQTATTYDNFVCAAVLNAGSEKAAQERALKDCEKTRQRYKIKSVGRCEVYASK